MKNTLTPDQAWPRIKHYCAYAERCHFEVKEKLFSFGLAKNNVETLICRLIEEDRLNEERFAILFAGGHFRQKKWGKQKIAYALKQKRVGENLIKRALKEIDGADYEASLQKLARTKWKTLQGEPWLARQAKTRSYLLQKGYEPAAVREAIAQLGKAL